MNYFLDVVRNKYAQFNGRAGRSEFWYFALFNFVISLVLELLDSVLGLQSGLSNVGILSGLFSLAMIIPGIAVSVRRLHDTGRSGWWLLLIFAVLIGWIALLVFYCQDSQEGTNEFGPNPKTGEMDVADHLID